MNATMKEAMTFLQEVAASLTELIQRWDNSVLPQDVNIGEIPTLLPCHFHQANLKFETKEATTIHLVVVVAASSAELVQI